VLFFPSAQKCLDPIGLNERRLGAEYFVFDESNCPRPLYGQEQHIGTAIGLLRELITAIVVK
jgi:hypothetical protein